MSQLMLSLLLLTVIGFGLVGIEDSFAESIIINNQSNCEDDLGWGWEAEFPNTCTAGDDILIGDGETFALGSGIGLDMDGGEFTVEAGGIADNSGKIFNFEPLDVVGEFNNNPGGIIDGQTTIFINGEFNNFAGAKIINDGGINISSQIESLLTNSGIIETNNDAEFIVSGDFVNTSTGNYTQISGSWVIKDDDAQSSGTVKLFAGTTAVITGTLTIPGTSVDGFVIEGTLDIDEGLPTGELPHGKIVITGGSVVNLNTINLENENTKIEITGGTLTTTGGTIGNACGVIIETSPGDIIGLTEAADLCPIESIIINPLVPSGPYGDATEITFSALALDTDEFGTTGVDVSENIVWTDQDDDLLCDGTISDCSSFIVEISKLGTNTITATITDGGGNSLSTSITIDILDDLDNDGYLSDTIPGGTDCNDNAASVNPGAVELVDGVDTDCNPLTPLIADEEDIDTDTYIPAATFGPDGWLGPIPEPGLNDCNDNAASVNPDPLTVELVDGVDTDCNPATPLLADEIDADGDLFIPAIAFETSWLGPAPTPALNDCYDVTALPGDEYFGFDPFFINPNAVEVADGVDNNCDGIIDSGIDADGDGYMLVELKLEWMTVMT